MEEVSSLAQKIKEYFPIHQARITFMSQFILALLKSRSTNLYRIAENFQTCALTESSYRRIKRFFNDYDLDLSLISQLVLDTFDLNDYTLCMDRTNWKHGNESVNFLVISIVWQETSIPLVWECLDKNGGNSNCEERISLLSKALKLIPSHKISRFIVDREFDGESWLIWLIKEQVPFCLRIKKNTKIEHKSKICTASSLFRNLGFRDSFISRKPRKIFGLWLYIAAHRTVKGLMIVVGQSKPADLLIDYQKRWGIETLFGCLKTRGFALEATHMSENVKMDKLFGLVAIAFAWCLTTGFMLFGEAKKLPLNKHYRPEKSLFRLGLDTLRRVLLNKVFKHENIDFNFLLNVLSRT